MFPLRLVVLTCVIATTLSVLSWYPNSALRNTTATSIVALHLRRHGLCNRLRSMAAAYALAQDAKLTLLVDWQAETSCNATFEELFQTVPMHQDATHSNEQLNLALGDFGPLPLYVTSTLVVNETPDNAPVPNAQERNTRISTSLQQTEAFSRSGYAHKFYHVSSAFMRTDFFLRYRTSNVLHLTTDTPNVPEHIPCTEFFQRKSTFYRALQLSPAVQRALGLVTSEFSKYPRVIGLHVRTHDPKHDYAVVPGRTAPRVTFGSVEAAPLGAFIRAVHAIRNANPDYMFFLSTNDCSGEVFRALQQASGGRLLTAAQVLSAHDSVHFKPLIDGFCSQARNKWELSAALTDLYSLGHTSTLIGSYFSSFTEEAAVINQIPLIAISNGEYFTMVPSPEYLPATCGHNAYLNRYRGKYQQTNPKPRSLQHYVEILKERPSTQVFRDDETASFQLQLCTNPTSQLLAKQLGLPLLCMMGD